MNEFIEQFLLEARELVAQAIDDLLALEAGAATKDRIDSLFRSIHTLKGAAGIVDFDAMGRALHAAEDMLSEMRQTSQRITPNAVANCLACLDQTTRWLEAMEAAGDVPADADAAADRIIAKFADVPAGIVSGATASNDHGWLARSRAAHADRVKGARAALRYRPDRDAFFRGEDPLQRIAAVAGVTHIELALLNSTGIGEIDPFTCEIEIIAFTTSTPAEVASLFGDIKDQVEILSMIDYASEGRLSLKAKSLLKSQISLLQVSAEHGLSGRIVSAGRVVLNVLRHQGLASEATTIESALARSLAARDPVDLTLAIEAALREPPAAGVAEISEPSLVGPSPGSRAMRITMERIDTLVALTGELTVVKNAIGHVSSLAKTGQDPELIAAKMREQHILLERLVAELQATVLSIRVLPLRQTFQRFPRLVREISASVGKSVRFVTDGDDTEADAAIVESLFEPLLHLVRNAIDHGIEDPRARVSTGKTSPANIVLRARRHLENVVIEIEDDGRGIDVSRVREVAVARNVVPAEILAEMDEAATINLIFAPGFSTAAAVTGLSGRGVGMDSVKESVERIGGHVSLETEPGRGTLVRLSLPFSVMMTRVMTVEAAGQVFGFPLDTVVETVMVPREKITMIGKGRVFVLRDRAVPLIDLSEVLGLPDLERGEVEARVVVMATAGQLGGIEVDRLGERVDVILKPLDGVLSGMKGVAGTTLLGDGRVLIVLDIQEFLQ